MPSGKPNRSLSLLDPKESRSVVEGSGSGNEGTGDITAGSMSIFHKHSVICPYSCGTNNDFIVEP